MVSIKEIQQPGSAAHPILDEVVKCIQRRMVARAGGDMGGVINSA